jgi:5-(carboxyamino)imidazole ribonucleotide mutase
MKIIIIYGSENDRAYLDGGKTYLRENGMEYEEKVLSVHRNFEELSEYLDSLRTGGEKCVFIAVAGLSAALPGIVAVRTDMPVIGVPVPAALNGIDALLSIIQMPGGVPVASVGIHGKAPLNACILAGRIASLAG